MKYNFSLPRIWASWLAWLSAAISPQVKKTDPPLICLRCPEPTALERDVSAEPEIEFFVCPNCHRRYAKVPGQPLTFRWPNPISIALYGFAFRSGPMSRHVAMAVMSLTKNKPPEQVSFAIHELTLELENPTQPVHLILPGIARTEEECRLFLLSVLNKLKS